jgi:nucleoside-diphosphate-sugar epimerase
MLVLVTGATGLLGRHLVALLLANGVRVRALARPSSDTRALEQQGVEVVRGEYRDRAILQAAVAGSDIVFHIAGYVSALAPFTIGEPEGAAWGMYRAINVEFTAALLAASREASVNRFLYLSSSSVYSPSVAVPTPEEAALEPFSLYGRSKLLAEAAVNAYQGQGFATTIIRPTIAYGPGDRAFTPLALRLARLPVLPLVNGGRQRLDLVYAADVAALLWAAARHPAAAGRVYNAGSGQPISLYELITLYKQLTGRGPHILPVPSRALAGVAGVGRPLLRPLGRWGAAVASSLSPQALALLTLDLQLDIRRATAELGYRPRYRLAEGLALTLGYI